MAMVKIKFILKFEGTCGIIISVVVVVAIIVFVVVVVV
jgi:hypothetical protein